MSRIGAVTLVECRPADWNRRFEVLRSQLQGIVPNALIEHIGSTAVPDLPSKDVVDVLVGVDHDHVAETASLLSDHEFDLEGQRAGHSWLSWPHRQERTVVVHVVEAEGQEWHERVAFRDLLRSDSGARARYLSVKRAAAADATGWGEYTARKAGIVTALLRTIHQD